MRLRQQNRHFASAYGPAIARITGRSRSTIARWLERAAASAKRFNDERLPRFEIKELQVDELCSFVGNKTNVSWVWVFSIIEVTSRLWPTSVVGRRSYHNTELLFNETARRGNIVDTVFVTSDGFEFCEKVVRSVSGVVAMAYLQRRSPAHARCDRRRDEDLALVQCHDNFHRPHRALKFGPEIRTPAMRGGGRSPGSVTKHRPPPPPPFESPMRWMSDCEPPERWSTIRPFDFRRLLIVVGC